MTLWAESFELKGSSVGLATPVIFARKKKKKSAKGDEDCQGVLTCSAPALWGYASSFGYFDRKEFCSCSFWGLSKITSRPWNWVCYRTIIEYRLSADSAVLCDPDGIKRAELSRKRAVSKGLIRLNYSPLGALVLCEKKKKRSDCGSGNPLSQEKGKIA